MDTQLVRCCRLRSKIVAGLASSDKMCPIPCWQFAASGSATMMAENSARFARFVNAVSEELERCLKHPSSLNAYGCEQECQ